MLILALVAAGCAGDLNEPVLHSAASLTDVVPDLVDAFGVTGGRTDFRLNVGGSSALAAQIGDGAPSGVFLAADEVTMGIAVDSGEASDPVVFARNRLVLVRRPRADVTGLADLAERGLAVGLCAPSVPCGSLARSELAARSIDPAVDTEEPDVRSLLAKVVAGELDAALVYATDAIVGGEAIEVVPIDLAGTTPYLAAVVGSDPPSGSTEFVAFLRSPEAQQVFAAAGFEAP
ncbi:MAG TPA: molybdate ABC transporter substrate-binding protein [Acidimicrobiales bacterium]|nr:molybdate ABC transporter substrate-binding protein [Acidimicrobiales bacterium]